LAIAQRLDHWVIGWPLRATGSSSDYYRTIEPADIRVLAVGVIVAPLGSPHLVAHDQHRRAVAGTKLIAEAWDAAGLYQVGSFIGDRWQEWNGQFRDDVRRFLKGDNGSVSAVAARILGSPDICSSPGV